MLEERTQEIFDRLATLKVSLPSDPVSMGPTFMQDLISKTRGYLNETSTYLQEVLTESRRAQNNLAALEAAFEVQSDHLLANDTEVKQQPSLQDRLALINVKLKADRSVITARRSEITNLGHIEKVIRHRHRELENTMSAIRLQRTLIASEIRTGAMFGDESDTSRGSKFKPPAQVNDGLPPLEPEVTLEDLEKIMAETLGQPDAPTPPVVPLVEGSPNRSGDPQIDAFLDPNITQSIFDDQ